MSSDDRCDVDRCRRLAELAGAQRSWRSQKEEEAQRQRRGTIDGEAQRKLSNQTHRSRTDPDATLAQKRGTPRQLKYKVHQTIDADSRVILDTEVTTGARHDNQPYLDQLQRIRDRYKITIREAIADRGYGSAAIIRTLQAQGVETYLPLWSGRVGNSKYLKVRIDLRERARPLPLSAGEVSDAHSSDL